MGTIIIKDLEIMAKHGVNPEEKINPQPFVFTVWMDTDISNAANDDDLNKTINYAGAKKLIVKFVQENTFDLIETLVTRVADLLLANIEILKKVKVLVKKPEAPMSGKFDYVGVEVEKKWSEVYLSLGSNLDNREGYLDLAIEELKKCSKIKNIKESTRIQTEPYGGVADQIFLNSAVKLDTTMNPQELLHFVNGIEAKANRKRDIHWGNRTLDIDIIFFDDLVIGTDDLCVPHIDMQNRDFVLTPLKELCPNKVHPLLNKRVIELYNDLNCLIL